MQTFLETLPGDSTIPTAAPLGYKLYIEDWTIKTTFNLASGLPCRMIVYPFVARRDIPKSEVSLLDIFTYDLQYEQKAISGTITPSVPGTTPFASHRLCSYVKFGRPRQYVFRPATYATGRQTASIKLRLKNKVINRYQYTRPFGTLQAENLFVGRKGMLRGALVRFIGMLTNDNTGATPSTLPKMIYPGAQINIVQEERIRIRESSEQLPHYFQASTQMSSSGPQTLLDPGTSKGIIGNWNSYPIS